MKMNKLNLCALLACFLAPAVLAAVPMEMPLQGVVRDNAGNPANGDFEVTFALYPAADSEAVDAVWWNTQDITVVDGVFLTRLGEGKPLDPTDFSGGEALWLGMAIEGEDELPRRPLGSSATALHAATAAGLDCSGCVGLSALTDAAQSSLVDQALAAVQANGYSTVASGLYYDDAAAELGANDVQAAIDAVSAKVNDIEVGAQGNVNEGAGTVRGYSDQWGMPSYGTAVEYIHLMKPSPPKVQLYLHGGENTGFASSNNLIVSNGYTPNTYSGGANGDAGDDTLTVSNAGAFNTGDHILIHQTIGPNHGQWELNAVQAINGNSLKLAKGLVNDYVSDNTSTTNSMNRAQVVIAASYNTFEVVNGGEVYPSSTLSGDYEENYAGGIVYVRARQLTVKNGGKIHADQRGYRSNGWNSWNNWTSPGDSECGTNPGGSPSANCSGGGGGISNSGCSCNSRGGGGGANKTDGGDAQNGCNWSQPEGGNAKGSDGDGLLHFGGAGGRGGYNYGGGDGGGLVVMGAETVIVEAGGSISANAAHGNDGNDGQCHGGGGGGAGGTVALFADNFDIQGTVEALGGDGANASGNIKGGDGGEGWVHQSAPIPGIINQSYATGVEIWIDGQEVTASVGDPNGKGSPHWNAETKKWGATGTEAWSSGPLDLTNVANWTLGEHIMEFKETGGAGGDLKAYTYVIHSYTESTPPANDTCTTPLAVDLSAGEVVISGTTEDVMGKTLATDASSALGCGGIGGPDVVYQIELAERSLLHASLIAPYSAKMYVRDGACADGEIVYCADNALDTNPLEAGTYFLVVDSDAAQAKGNFNLTLSATPAPLPVNDTCEDAMELVLGANGEAVHSGTNLYALDQYKGLCPAALSGGPDTVYHFIAGTGQTLNVTVDAEFETILYVMTLGCGEGGVPLACNAGGSLAIPGLAGGDYWLFVDGAQEKAWGSYELTLTLQ
jgi:hypothetical protein